VLRALPVVEVTDSSPPRARRDPTCDTSPEVLAELERRLRMWADLLERGGPERVPPALVRELRLFGSFRRIWIDADRTRVPGRDAIAVSVLHTGRVHPEALSDTELTYHYPHTNQPGRDESEIRALKRACDLRLPVFAILQDGELRTVRKGWV